MFVIELKSKGTVKSIDEVFAPEAGPSGGGLFNRPIAAIFGKLILIQNKLYHCFEMSEKTLKNDNGN